MGVNGIGGDASVQQGSVRGKGTRMFVLVTVGGEEIAAVGGTVDANFALCATTDGTDSFGFRRTKAARFALLANWTSHKRSPGKLREKKASLNGLSRLASSRPSTNRISRHDDFVVEAASSNDEEKSAHGEKSQGIGPKMDPSRAAKDDAAGDVDEIGGWHEVAEGEEEFRHGFTREDVAGEKDTGKDSKERELHGLSLGGGLAGDENAERERDEDVGKRKKSEQEDAAMNGNAEEETHGSEDHAEFEETDKKVRKKLAEEQAHRADWCDEELFERATLFFANDGKGGKESGDVEEENRGKAGQEEIGRARIWIEEDFGAHVDGKADARTGQDAAKGFIKANGGGDVNGLAGNGRIGAIDENENLSAHLVEEFIGVVDRNFDADAAFTGNDGVVEVFIIVDEADEAKRVGIPEAVEEFAAFAAAIGVVDDGIDLTDVGVDAVTEQQHLEHGNDE